MIEEIASSANLDAAYAWLCKARREAHDNNDVWHLRFHWKTYKPHIKQQLLNGTYCFKGCTSYKVNGQYVSLWAAEDALVLKALSLVFTQKLSPQLAKECYHIAGNGGSKTCVTRIKQQVNHYKFVCRSDVDSYYATINHRVLLGVLGRFVKDQKVLSLIRKMLTRVDDVNGVLHVANKGITKGNPLSPLLGALYLYQMDSELGAYCRQRGLVYARFMDDWVVLCKTRYQLRDVVRIMNKNLQAVQQTKHPFKTYIGKMKALGFDFLGYRIEPNHEPLKMAWKTWANYQDKLLQLYEQNTCTTAIATYVKHWIIWAKSGVPINLEHVIRVAKQKLESLGIAKETLAAINL